MQTDFIHDKYVILKQGAAAIAIELAGIKSMRREALPLRFHVTSALSKFNLRD